MEKAERERRGRRSKSGGLILRAMWSTSASWAFARRRVPSVAGREWSAGARHPFEVRHHLSCFLESTQDQRIDPRLFSSLCIRPEAGPLAGNQPVGIHASRSGDGCESAHGRTADAPPVGVERLRRKPDSPCEVRILLLGLLKLEDPSDGWPLGLRPCWPLLLHWRLVVQADTARRRRSTAPHSPLPESPGET